VPLGDQTVTLEDIRFLPSTASSPLTINPEEATVTYAGQTTLQIGETLNLAARVTQAADGEMGDLTLAQVLFEIIDQSSSVVATATGAVDAQGNSTATLSGLAAGQYRIRLSVVGVYFTSTSSEALLNVTSPPICSGAYPSTSQWIWPPNNEFYLRSVAGVTDTQGRPFSVTITGVRQDEPVGTGSASPDAFIISPNLVQLRAERDGSGDGRVYHIFFIAANDLGGSCSGVVRVGVSDNQGGGIDPIDDGPLYDSTVPSPIAAQPASASLTSLALILAPAALSSRKSRETFLTIRCP
jgi:hypothetical protein